MERHGRDLIQTDIKAKCALWRDGLFRILSEANALAVKREKLLFWTAAILYKFLLDAMYILAASQQDRLVYVPSFVKYVISSLLYLGIFAVLPKRERDTVSFLLHLQFVLTIAPMLSYYALANGSSRYMLMVTVCVLLQLCLVGKAGAPRKPIHITGITNYVTVALGVLVLFTLVVPVLYNGFEGLKAFDFEYLYVMRANATYPRGFPYLLGWTTNTILPFAFLYFLHVKKYLFAVSVAALQMIFYMEMGNKFVALILIPLAFIYFLSKSGHLIKLLYVGFAALCLAVIIGYQLDSVGQTSRVGILLNALVGIRALFFPAYIKFNFYDCFNQLPKLHFSDGMLGKLFSETYLYRASGGHVVDAYAGKPFLAAETNTGYLGEAYGQLGFLGMLLMSALLGLILRWLRAYDSKRTFAVLTALFSVYFIILNDGALFTTLFTGGMLMAFLLVFVYFGKQTEDSHDGIQRL